MTATDRPHTTELNDSHWNVCRKARALMDGSNRRGSAATIWIGGELSTYYTGGNEGQKLLGFD
jgi:hypothetical protein